MNDTRTLNRVAFVAIAIVLAILVGFSSTIGALILAAIGTALAVRLRPAALVTLAFAAAWLTKPIVETLALPRFLEFIDLPLVVLACFIAFTHAPADPERPGRLGARVLYLPAIAVAVSTLVNVDSIVRGLGGGLLLLEPLLAIVAIDRVGMTPRERRRAEVTISAVLLLQVFLALVQTATGAEADGVRGTLAGAGAGAHVMGSAVLLGLVAIPFLLRRSPLLAFPLLLLSLVIALRADALTPLFVLPFVFVAAMIIASVGRTPERQTARRLTLVAGALVMLLAMVLATRFVSLDYAQNKFELATSGPNSKGALAQQIVEQLREDPVRLVYGFGPAQSVTRLALLSSPTGRRSGSPVESLGLEAPSGFDVTRGRTATASYESTSITSPTSSVLGVVGDYGLLGLLGFGYAWLMVARAVWKARGPTLVTIALAGWLSLIPLGIVYDWPEQPPYTLLVALLVSLATAPVLTSSDRPEAARAADEPELHERS